MVSSRLILIFFWFIVSVAEGTTVIIFAPASLASSKPLRFGTKTEISQPAISIRPCMISCAPSMAGTAFGLTKLATSIPGKFAFIK